ncbi:hypothetical protein BC834DRAFT_887080 [Gloeopeniophorella convolvens]|nr:hypothetical protein BC834DRAFT_887080 [Gloeopeniophorella convolvens]
MTTPSWATDADAAQSPIDNPSCVDLILLSSDGMQIGTQLAPLANASPVFSMLLHGSAARSVKQPSGHHILSLSIAERGHVLSKLIRALHRDPTLTLDTFDEATLMMATAHKYRLKEAYAFLQTLALNPAINRVALDRPFGAFCVARRLGLVHDAFSAALTTIRTCGSIEGLQMDLHSATPACLQEFWEVRSQLMDNTRTSLEELRASLDEQARWSSCAHPVWLEAFYDSLVDTQPILTRDRLMEELREHVDLMGCASCDKTSPDKFHAWFDAVFAAVDRGISQTYEAFPQICKTSNAAHAHSYMQSDYYTSFSYQEADMVLRSGDSIDFPVYSAALTSASPTFASVLTSEWFQRTPRDPTCKLPVLRVAEYAPILWNLLGFMVSPPTQPHLEVRYEDTLAILGTAQRYKMDGVMNSIRNSLRAGRLPNITNSCCLSSYGLASSYNLGPEAKQAALIAIQCGLTFEVLSRDIHVFNGPILYELLDLQRRRRDAMESSLLAALDEIPFSILAAANAWVSPPVWKGRPVPWWWRNALNSALIQVRNGGGCPSVESLAFNILRYLGDGQDQGPQTDAYDGLGFCDALEAHVRDAVGEVQLILPCERQGAAAARSTA